MARSALANLTGLDLRGNDLSEEVQTALQGTVREPGASRWGGSRAKASQNREPRML